MTAPRRARDLTGFLAHDFPAALHRTRTCWAPTAVASLLVAALIGWWVATHREVRYAIAAPAELRELTRPGGDYEAYYSSLPATFVAAGTGLRLGWTVIDPGPRRRRDALAQEGRAALGMDLGLALVLLVSGAIEAFVTPSGLPT